MVRHWLVCVLVAAFAMPATAQEAKGPFGGFKHDREAPVEIASDLLEVRQADQIAIFTGNVIAGQGTLRLTADRMDVKFDETAEGEGETGAIQNVKATGNVFLSNGAETAQGKTAEYNLVTGIMTMQGDVVLTQGKNVGSGNALEINLNTGVAKLKGATLSGSPGRVKLSLQPSKNN